MKVGRQVIEKKRYAMRFTRNCGGLDGARPEGKAADQGQADAKAFLEKMAPP